MGSDAMLPHRSVAIVGGGFSGIAVAARLLAEGPPTLRIVLYERSERLGGLAYTTEDAEHLLNVPSDRMSLFPERPDDFVAFANEQGSAGAALRFLPRGVYGAYLRTCLDRAVALSGDRFRRVVSEVSAVHPAGGGWSVVTPLGAQTFDAVLLATGNGPPIVPGALRSEALAPWVVREPYARGALACIPREAPVLVLGLRLTAYDIIASLRASGHSGPVVALSRTGRLPAEHLAEVRWRGRGVTLEAPPEPLTADRLADWYRAEVARAEADGAPWQAVTDAVRSRVAELWQRLAPAERSRFLKVHRGAWEQVRHRVPTVCAEALRCWIASGWLESVAGEVVDARPGSGELWVSIRTRDGVVSQRPFGAVLCCAGRLSDPRRFDEPVWRQLLEDGLVTPDADGLGLLASPDGAVSGAPPGLFAIGSLLRPQTYESTAVPELAVQARMIASALSVLLSE